MPYVALAVLTLFSVGALVGSLLQAPPLAGTLLHAAAGNTAGASSLRIVESIGQVQSGRLVTLDSQTEILQPPDRIEASQRSQLELAIGTNVYISTDGGRTWSADTTVHPNVAQDIAAVLAPLSLFRTATQVRMSHGQTRFTFSEPAPALVGALHLNLPGPQARSTVPVTVDVRGEFVTSWSTVLALGGQRYVLTEQYTGLNNVPMLVAPSLSPAP